MFVLVFCAETRCTDPCFKLELKARAHKIQQFVGPVAKNLPSATAVQGRILSAWYIPDS